MTWTTRPRSEIAGLSAITMGSGPNVVLLHGVGLCADAWGAQLEALAPHGCVTAPDMPGHGACALPGRDMVLDDYIQAADGLLATLDGPALVVGHSMGAMMALGLAACAPDRVRGVVALNGVFERSDKATDAVQSRAAQLDGKTVADPGTTLARWFGTSASQERTACQHWLMSVNPAAYKMAYTAFAHSQMPDRATLVDMACPALFMTGQLEPNSTPGMSRAMADLTPMGRAEIVEGAAHMMPMTHSSQVNAALLDMLREVA